MDFYAFSFYKAFGPHYALLYGKKDHLLSIPGFNHYFITEPNEIPLKFQPGGVNYELCHGLPGLTDYLTDLFFLSCRVGGRTVTEARCGKTGSSC